MKRKKTTRNALLTSVLAMLLCVSMLVGTTFAWFTDEVVSGNNVIAAGNLDVELEYWNGSAWVDVSGKTDVLTNTLWEPGVTEVAYLKVTNAGSLALKYKLGINIVSETAGINVAGENFKLSDYIDFGVVEDVNGETAAYATREAAISAVAEAQKISEGYTKESSMLSGDELYLALVVYMPETVGNEANYRGTDVPTIDLGIELLAAQYTYEEDSFDDQYDADAEYLLRPGKFFITNLEELQYAMKAGGEGTVMNDIVDVYAELGAGKALDLNLNGMTLSGTDNNYVIVNNGDLTVTGDGTITSNLYGSIENWGSLLVDDLVLNVSGEKYGFHCKDGVVEIYDIDLTAQRGGVNVQGGKVIINSGKVTTTSYGTKIGYLVYAASNDSAEVIINGGDFRYVPGYYRHGVLYAGQNASIVVNGGTFGMGGSNTAKTKWITEANGGTVTIYGGSFEFDPSEFVAEGYQAVKGADGWWTVSAIAG